MSTRRAPLRLRRGLAVLALAGVGAASGCYAPDEAAVETKLEACGVESITRDADGNENGRVVDRITSPEQEQCLLDMECDDETSNTDEAAACLSGG